MVTITPLNTMLDRMVTLSRAMDQAFVNGSTETLKPTAQPAWVPELDAWETEQEYVVQLDLPGVKTDGVEISFEKNTLTIRGERPRGFGAPEKGELRVFFAERDWGSFSRSLRFPQHVAGDNISATFDAGVLTVRVPKSEAAKPRKIQINVPTNEVKQVEG
ncbi:MAG TPA: Hsp20/alpha crystallin family protein [Gemmatimonadaceae bacterium]|nr:Hsp20/alpha crystallin family protein [Gemmatimonadaceae bacterium]